MGAFYSKVQGFTTFTFLDAIAFLIRSPVQGALSSGRILYDWPVSLKLIVSILRVVRVWAILMISAV